MKQFATATRRLRTIAVFIGSVLFPFSVRGQTIANPSPTDLTAPLVFVPVLTEGGRIFAPGFSAAGNFVNAGDRIFLQAGATASFSFSVPSGQIRTVAYGIPTGGYVNTVPAEISVNGATVATITEGLGGFGVTIPTRLILWRKSFGPGNYTLTIRSGGASVNVYGLWMSGPLGAYAETQSLPSGQPAQAPPDLPVPKLEPLGGASIVQAVIRAGATSLELPQGRMYLYGMTTGGGVPSTAFTAGQYAQAVDAAGKLSDALAYGTSSQNSYSTQTVYHDIGGVSIAGTWKHFTPYYGLNEQSGAHDASVSFEVKEDSLVVVLGLASSQQFVSVEGIPGLQVDASRDGGGMVIAHVYVKPGNYTVTEYSKVLAAGQDLPHMADLVGAFVFGGRQAQKQPAVVSEQAHVAGIRSVDFLNFDYPSDCWEQFNGFDKTIHISNGEWNKDDVGSFVIRKKDSAWMMTYGDLDGDGQDEAMIVTSCQGQTNFNYEEVFVFASASAGPKLLARLSPSDWGKGEEGNGSYFPVTSVRASDRQLAVSFLAGGSHACPAWTVTARFQWNGSGLARTGVDRKPFNCQK